MFVRRERNWLINGDSSDKNVYDDGSLTELLFLLGVRTVDNIRVRSNGGIP